MITSVCTLFEGDYHYGVGALVNSLYHHGFQGVIWAGYRGVLPPWAKPLRSCQNYQEYIVAENCVIRFIQLDVPIHFANYKPDFMLDLWENYCPEIEALFYFDPDIVIKCRWSFYEEWIEGGIALCQEIVNAYMPSNHPIRKVWENFAKHKGYSCHRQLNQYFNSGFIGLYKNYRSALFLWQNLLKGVEGLGIELSIFMPTDRSQPFLGTDQDTLNLMAMITPHPLSTIGPEGMDFLPGGFTMSHAVGKPKPWQKHMIYEALSGKAPTSADKGYWQHTQSPIQLYSKQKFFWQQVDLRCGSAIGRFIGRNKN